MVFEIEVLLPTGYDVIVIPPPGVLYAISHDGFWKSGHDFLIAFHSNILSAMHGSRDNEVSLQAGYDVIIISLLGVALRYFYMKNSERVTVTSWSRSIEMLYLWCMVSEITRFYCKPDVTSSWFLRQGRCTQFLNCRFWKGDPDFISVLHCNYTSFVHRFQFN